MPRGGVDHDEGCPVHRRETRRQGHAQLRGRQSVGAEAAGAAEAGHALAHLQVLHAFPHRAHDARVFGARHKGQGGFHLVLVLHDQQIGEIQAGGLDFNQHFARLGLGGRQFFPHQGFDADRVFAQPGLHVVSS
ncbi:hypothetical protein D9M68_715460 [compost metagenome]